MPSTYQFKPFVMKRCEPTTDVKPRPRSGHKVVCDNTNMYSFGGYNPDLDQHDSYENDINWRNSQPLFYELWKFNFSLKKWTRIPAKNLPPQLISNCVMLCGNYLIVYGGCGVPFGVSIGDAVYVCDLSNKEPEFTEISSANDSNQPTPMYGQQVFLKDGFFYVTGGTSGYVFSMDIHRFKLSSCKWENVYTCVGNEVEPGSRYKHGIAVKDNLMYILGGGTIDSSFGFAEIPTFNLISRKWTNKICFPDIEIAAKGIPLARKNHATIQIPNENSVIVLGGFGNKFAISDCWKLDLNTMRWNSLKTCSLPYRLHFHDACVTPSGKLYSFGGIKIKSGQNDERTNDIFCAWVTIPSLKEIAWEAVIFYEFHLSYSYNELYENGVPMEFLQRLKS